MGKFPLKKKFEFKSGLNKFNPALQGKPTERQINISERKAALIQDQIRCLTQNHSTTISNTTTYESPSQIGTWNPLSLNENGTTFYTATSANFTLLTRWRSTASGDDDEFVTAENSPSSDSNSTPDMAEDEDSRANYRRDHMDQDEIVASSSNRTLRFSSPTFAVDTFASSTPLSLSVEAATPTQVEGVASILPGSSDDTLLASTIKKLQNLQIHGATFTRDTFNSSAEEETLESECPSTEATFGDTTTTANITTTTITSTEYQDPKVDFSAAIGMLKSLPTESEDDDEETQRNKFQTPKRRLTLSQQRNTDIMRRRTGIATGTGSISKKRTAYVSRIPLRVASTSMAVAVAEKPKVEQLQEENSDSKDLNNNPEENSTCAGAGAGAGAGASGAASASASSVSIEHGRKMPGAFLLSSRLPSPYVVTTLTPFTLRRRSMVLRARGRDKVQNVKIPGICKGCKKQ